ncbi:hypothetical protein FACS189485_21500 [Spirochaetia bacterium]|nr:hypothetical protein FACS189485_21500 [Spirochaetia bacterium]
MDSKISVKEIVKNKLPKIKNGLKKYWKVILPSGSVGTILVAFAFNYFAPILPKYSPGPIENPPGGIKISVAEITPQPGLDEESQVSTEEIEFRRHQTAERLHGTGKAYFDNGDFENAIVEFNKSTAEDINFSISYIDCAVAYARLEPRNYQAIINNYTKALNCIPPPSKKDNVETELAKTYLEYGYQLYNNSGYTLAIDCFSNAINYFHNDLHNVNVLQAYYNRGCSHYFLDEHFESESDYSIIIDNIKDDKKNEKVYFNVLDARGRCRYYQRKYNEAIIDYTNALNFEPFNSQIHKNLAQAYLSNGDYKQSEHHKQLAEEIDNNK